MAAITAEHAGNENLVKFLDLIAYSEGTSSSHLTRNSGYDVIVSGKDGPEIFTDYANHPFTNRQPKLIREIPIPRLYSTAAGRYQLLHRYFEPYKLQLHLSDFSPLSQDLIAIQQIREKHALEPIAAGDMHTAISLCSQVWASFPGNTYKQGGKSLDSLVEKFNTL